MKDSLGLFLIALGIFMTVILAATIFMVRISNTRLKVSNSRIAAQLGTGSVFIFTGLSVLTHGSRSTMWATLAGIMALSTFYLIKKIGVWGARVEPLDGIKVDDEQVTLVGGKPGATSQNPQAILVLNIKRGWMTERTSMPKVFINGLAIKVSAGENIVEVSPGATLIDVYCLDRNRYGDASLEIDIVANERKVVYYAQPANTLTKNGAIGEFPMGHPHAVKTIFFVGLAFVIFTFLALGAIYATVVAYLQSLR